MGRIVAEDEISLMIEDCQNRQEKLSDWEVGFIDSIDARLGDGHSLTELQQSTLEKIWDRIT